MKKTLALLTTIAILCVVWYIAEELSSFDDVLRAVIIAVAAHKITKEGFAP